MFNRRPEEELHQSLAAEGIGCIAFSPLAQGMLTEKYREGVPEGSRASNAHGALKPAQLTKERMANVIGLNSLAKGRRQTLAQLALAWVLRHPGMTLALIGVSKVAQPEDAVVLVDMLALSAEELQAIEGVLNYGGTMSTWLHYALLSAVFAALTAIFAKIGIRDVDSDLATLVRTGVIIVVLACLVVLTGKWSNPLELSGKTLGFLILSGLATGASWVCYFRALKAGEASKVAPVDKLSLVLVALFAVIFLGERPQPREWLGIGLVAAGVLVLSFRR